MSFSRKKLFCLDEQEDYKKPYLTLLYLNIIKHQRRLNPFKTKPTIKN